MVVSDSLSLIVIVIGSMTSTSEPESCRIAALIEKAHLARPSGDQLGYYPFRAARCLSRFGHAILAHCRASLAIFLGPARAYLKAHGIQVSHGSIHAILKQNHLPMRTYTPRRQRTYTRFQREHPDSLWQTDIKYYGDEYPIAYLDDCSRYLPAIELYSEATTENLLSLTDDALSQGRIPSQVLSDHGPQYYSDNGKSRYTLYLEAHGIEHIMGSIGKPTTQGKIERFFQTFELYYPRFNDLDRFREYYNNKPHRSLNYKTPAQVCLN